MAWFITLLTVVVWVAGTLLSLLKLIRSLGGFSFPWRKLPGCVFTSMAWPWDLYVSWGWRRADRKETDDD